MHGTGPGTARPAHQWPVGLFTRNINIGIGGPTAIKKPGGDPQTAMTEPGPPKGIIARAGFVNRTELATKAKDKNMAKSAISFIKSFIHVNYIIF